MLHRFLDQLAREKLPIFVTDRRQVAKLRRLLRAGYVDGRLYPETSTPTQFAQVRGITPLGERVRSMFHGVKAYAGVVEVGEDGLWPSCEAMSLRRTPPTAQDEPWPP